MTRKPKTCAHLAPIEEALAKRKLALKAIESPYSDKNRWFGCACTFDERALRKRLELAREVEYAEYDGRVAGSDATFTCSQCHCVVMGLHPLYALKKTPRLA